MLKKSLCNIQNLIFLYTTTLANIFLSIILTNLVVDMVLLVV